MEGNKNDKAPPALWVVLSFTACQIWELVIAFPTPEQLQALAPKLCTPLQFLSSAAAMDVPHPLQFHTQLISPLCSWNAQEGNIQWFYFTKGPANLRIKSRIKSVFPMNNTHTCTRTQHPLGARPNWSCWFSAQPKPTNIIFSFCYCAFQRKLNKIVLVKEQGKKGIFRAKRLCLRSPSMWCRRNEENVPYLTTSEN